VNGREKYISKDVYVPLMPFIDVFGIHCGMTDCKSHEGLDSLRCRSLAMQNEYSWVSGIASIKTCPHYEKGEDGYTSEW
jgi:hypothetical protein